MMLRFIRVVAFGAYALLSALTMTTANATAADPALPVGPSITRPNPAITMQPGSYRLLPLRANDPDGGLPWAMATYLARPTANTRILVLCTAFGRVQNDQLGIVSEQGTFLPITPGASPQTACGGVSASHGERASGYVMASWPARFGPACSPATAQAAADAPPRACDLAALRTLFGISLGRGVESAAIQEHRHGPWTPLEDGGEGTFLAVRRGLFTDATTPTIRIRATTCGPDARLDLQAQGRKTGRCTATVDLPSGVRPAPESAASRRARRAKRLNAPIRIVERHGTASIRRFTARVTLPITVEVSNEAYAYRLRGPSGPGCNRTRTDDTSTDPLSSYLMIAGRPYDLPLLPLDLRRGVWCRGTYRLTVLFVRRVATSNRVRTIAKAIAATTFKV
ncbi:hypothetical protein [Conexibacter sp. CPCC 206217]|uniref:hypothetical protein n=1 Tax=Conexibacter sp. CPCC 206217 TaxID=3064574 RepID=UPI0027259CEF|nr:hypothetical protein [Conexibacter sp. CPCC 206217]MDO8209663.1 hypothetical protein [Conexibacter sp. CPCC 206217]